MEETGRIIKLHNDIAVIKMEMSDHCTTCGICSNNSGNDLTLEALNPIKAKIGNKVKIHINQKKVISSSFIIYIFPLLLLFLGYSIGFVFVQKITRQLSGETAGIICGFAGLTLSYIFIRSYENRVKNDPEFLPEIIEILNE